MDIIKELLMVYLILIYGIAVSLICSFPLAITFMTGNVLWILLMLITFPLGIIIGIRILESRWFEDIIDRLQ